MFNGRLINSLSRSVALALSVLKSISSWQFFSHTSIRIADIITRSDWKQLDRVQK